MPYLKEFVPDGLKQYLRLLRAKLRHPDCFIGSPFVGNRVTLGKGCSISRGTEVGNGVRIGDFSYLNCGAIVASGRIGRFCSIGPYALIGLADHPADYLSTSPLVYGPRSIFSDGARRELPVPGGTRDGSGIDLQEIAGTGAWNDFPSPPEIGSDVWIGARAFVRQGVRIGDGAIVGAGAIVTRDVPPYGIVAGVPARLLRYRFEPTVVEQLLRLRWWEFDLDELTRWRDRFHAPVDARNIFAVEGALR